VLVHNGALGKKAHPPSSLDLGAGGVGTCSSLFGSVCCFMQLARGAWSARGFLLLFVCPVLFARYEPSHVVADIMTKYRTVLY